jgi:hypothetical protein
MSEETPRSGEPNGFVTFLCRPARSGPEGRTEPCGLRPKVAPSGPQHSRQWSRSRFVESALKVPDTRRRTHRANPIQVATAFDLNRGPALRREPGGGGAA